MAKSPYEEIPEEIQTALKSIIDRYEMDDRAVRQRQVRIWKKLNFYWAGLTRISWDDVAHDWRVFDTGYGYETNDMGYYDKPINVFRPYMESIIAALSSTVPAIKCTPDDANNPNDILTARGGTAIAELVYKHIDAPLLWCKALFTYCTQGMIAAYSRTVTDERFGQVMAPDYETEFEEVETKVCPLCKAPIDDAAEDLKLDEEDEYNPGEDDVKLHSLYAEGKVVCPSCAMEIDPEIQKDRIIVTRLAGVTNQDKSRQLIDVVGGLFVKVPNWARSQDDCPYLCYSYETHYTNILKEYPWLHEYIDDLSANSTSTGNEMYDRWGRLSPQYFGEYPRATPTVRNWWLRPQSYWMIPDEKTREKVSKLFPDGVKLVYINDIFACAENEALDDHWTLTYNPLSEYIHFDPLGLLAVSVQDITQDLVSLTLQTIEHGVPQVFVETGLINMDAYKNTEVVPGSIYPVKPRPGKNIADSFHMIKTSSLSSEVMPFGDQIQSLGQFSTGALPSLFGGEQAGSSRTAAQYSMSRNQAQQRLQTTWKMINYWWARIFSKVIPAYMKTMLEDERIVKKVGPESFINVCIKRSELDGKIGEIEVESADTLPATWGQVRDTIMEMIQSQNPMFMESLTSADNIGMFQDALGLSQFKLPGESDRVKQFEEIQVLLQSTPEMGPDGQEMPSIMPDFEVDNHKIEGDVCRSWLVGEAGRQAKQENPEGYRNVLLHLKAHIEAFQQLQGMQVSPVEQGNQGNPQQSNETAQPQSSGEPKLRLVQ